MRTFAVKPKALQQTKTAESTKSGQPHYRQNPDVHSVLQLQRTAGNKAVQRLLQSETEKLQSLAQQLHDAISGADTDRERLALLFYDKSDTEIQTIMSYYKTRFEADIWKDVALALRESFRGPGTDEEKVYQLLFGFPRVILVHAINYYNSSALNNHTGGGFAADIEDEFSGNEFRRVLKILDGKSLSLWYEKPQKSGEVGKLGLHLGPTPTHAEEVLRPQGKKKVKGQKWIGLLVRGKRHPQHEPGLMEQHADVVLPGLEERTRGYFPEKGRKAEGQMLSRKGVSADMKWFLQYRPHYVDLEMARSTNTRTTVILLRVTEKQAGMFRTYWENLEREPGTFRLLAANCAAAAAVGFVKADVIREVPEGLNITPNLLFKALKKRYPEAYIVSGYYGYLKNDEGGWDGPYIVDLEYE